MHLRVNIFLIMNLWHEKAKEKEGSLSEIPTELNLLIIEDSEDDAVLIVENLKRQGLRISFEIVETLDGFSSVLQSKNFQIIICDHSMPGFTSFDVLQRLKESKKDIPFIIVSGIIGEELAVEAMKQGAHDYVMKKNLNRLGPAIEREIQEAKIRVRIVKAQEDLKESEQMYKKLSEELTESVKVRDEFIAIASHEFKTPISTLLLQVELSMRMLSQGKISAYGPEHLQKTFNQILKQTKNLSKLIDNLLGLAMLNMGKVKINPTPGIDLNILIQELVDELLNGIQNTDFDRNLIHLKLYDGPLIVNVDPERVEQVINNLISNAIKYGHRKIVEVTVSGSEEKWAEIQVKDHGDGIRTEDQEKIFKPFQRCLSTSHISGLGLGLFISSEIMKSHGGELLVESLPLEGATFIARFPLQNNLQIIS